MKLFLHKPVWVAICLLFATGLVYAEGPGVKLGDRMVFHPGLGLEFRFDSNFFAEPESAAPSRVFVMRLTPRLDFATRPPERNGNAPHGLDFRLHLGGTYSELLTGDNFLAAHRSFGVDASMLLTILPGHAFSIDIFDNYFRTVQPPYSKLPYNLDRDTNEAGIRLRYAPGGRRLEFSFGYTFGLDLFEVAALQDLNVFYHRLQFRALWRFFPKTAVYVDVTETPYHYQNVGIIAHPNSFPLRATAGLIGLLTTKLKFHAWVGYGNGFYTSGPSPNTPIGGLEFTWRPTLLSTGDIGYRHDFVNSLLGSYYDLDAAYIGWTQLIWRLRLGLRVQYNNIRYKAIPPSAMIVPNPTDRTDNYLSASARLDYPFKDWLIGGIGYTFQFNSPDSQVNSSSGAIPVGYQKHEAMVQLVFAY